MQETNPIHKEVFNPNPIEQTNQVLGWILSPMNGKTEVLEKVTEEEENTGKDYVEVTEEEMDRLVPRMCD